jgi:hypothetical protein
MAQLSESEAPHQSDSPNKFMGRLQRLASRRLLGVALFLVASSLGHFVQAAGEDQPNFKRISTQFIAALGEPGATSGSNAQLWGLWPKDPGPRGVRLNRYEQLIDAGSIAPAKWKFDSSDWWLEEHGLIMEAPEFPMASGKYLVTGDREAVTTLTIYPKQGDGSQDWELDNGVTLYDVTHLACRSARYTPSDNEQSCSPGQAQMSEFPIAPGGAMPPVENCNQQDYTVLLVIGVAIEN